MKPKTLTCVTAIALLAVLALPIQSVAQEHKQKLPHYAVMDLGTLGGSYSVANGISNSGWVSGISTLPGDTEVHAFLWRGGRMIDLGTLGGPDSNNFFLPNDRSEVTGSSETSNPDPLGEDACGFGTHLICLPFLWRNGMMIQLPTLGGYNGGAAAVNDRDEVVGSAENTTSDPTCIPPQVRQFEPVIWNNGEIRQLPNLSGDTVGSAHAINNEGQVTGWSGNCALTLFHALIWEKNGRVIDLGNLGGTVNTQGLAINDQGQVAGFGDLAGNTTAHGFVWQNGVMTDLEPLPGDVWSGADSINNKGQVLGASMDASGNVRGVIWQNGVITDLNTLIPPASPFVILFGDGINSGGQIAAAALLPSGQTHAVLMIPVPGEVAEESATPTAQRETTQRPNIAVPEIVRQLLQRGALFGGFRGGLVTPR